MVICQLCHREFKRIEGRHLKMKHNISMIEYKKMFPHSKITSAETSQKVSRANKKRWQEDAVYRQKMTERMQGDNNIVHLNLVDPEQRSNASRAVWKREGYKQKRMKFFNSEQWRNLARQQAKIAFSRFWNDKEWRERRRQAILGENNPQWKGGNTPRYYGPNWIPQRKKARKRDNYTCQLCGITESELGQKLDVHHIVSFREFNYIPNENENYKLANNLSNLISLCSTCHKKVEWHPELIEIQNRNLPDLANVAVKIY